jgi:hypothetical protein
MMPSTKTQLRGGWIGPLYSLRLFLVALCTLIVASRLARLKGEIEHGKGPRMMLNEISQWSRAPKADLAAQ